MGKNKVIFKSVPESIINVRTLGSLIFDKRNELGPGAILDFTGISKYYLLARDCIAALYEIAIPDRIASDQSFGSYKTSIRGLLSYCHHISVPDDFRMKDISFEFLLEYRAHLQLINIGFKSQLRRRRYGDILRLLEAGQSKGLSHSDFMPPCNFASEKDNDRTQPYTEGESLDFEDACRTHIREILFRLNLGNELKLQGKNPRSIETPRDPSTGRIMKIADCDRPWNQLSNLLWYVVNIMDGKYLSRHESRAQRHYSFENSVMGVWRGPYRKKHVYSHLYPLSEDLIPFIILLAKKIGRNESSILTLKRDCLKEVNGRYFLWYQKARGSARLYKKVINNKDQFSPVYLITTLQEITEPLVKHARPEDRNMLFLGLTIESHGVPIKSLDPSYIKYQMNRNGGWCDQRNLLDYNKRPLRVSVRRLRVTYLTNRYKKTGQLSKISRDAGHVLKNTTTGYVENESTKHIHEEAIVAGIKSLKSVAKPNVLIQESIEAVADNLCTDTTTAEKILRGEQEVIFASCKDFYNRPGGKPNTPCDKPWACFFCANAIITRHDLPRIIVLRNFMLDEKRKLVSDDWYAKFSKLWHVILHDVLPHFAPEVIAEAERLANKEVYYIPLAMRV